MASTRFLYLSSNDQGIFLSRFDPETGTLSAPQPVAGPNGTFFLARHPKLPVLYSVELAHDQVSAYQIGEEGALTAINTVASRGADPCHLALDAEGRFLVIANYNGGIVSYPLGADGALGEAASVYQPTGSGPDTERQAHAHPHGVALSEAGDYLYAADLGIDRVIGLGIDPHSLALSAKEELSVTEATGAGPRHFTLHPHGRLGVVVNELNNTATLYRRDPKDGLLTKGNTRSTLPAGFSEETWTAEIDFHPLAPMIYASNRGHGSLALFPYDATTGELGEPQWLTTKGKKPQHFAIDPSGRHLLIANVDANFVTVHPLDPSTGLPGPESAAVPLSQPMCLLFVP